MRYLVIVSAVIVLVVACSACQTQTPSEALAQELETEFNTNPGADARIQCLADLLSLTGQKQRARQLMESLSQPDKVALFKLSRPQTVAMDLIVVVKAFYIDLPNNADGNELLLEMNRPLVTLDDANARSLSGEINQWRQGRASYDNAQYAAAVEAYKSAIDLNPRNPGTLHDRALAYARLGQTGPALDDLAEVLRLNSNLAWIERVKRALEGDQALYSALWNQKEKYAYLAALVPAPTRTPTPTRTPAPTTPPPTPTSTRTPAPTTPPPTPTSTPTVRTETLPSPTYTSVPTSTAKPTAMLRPTVVPHLVSPAYTATCRNPITLRWSGALQWYEHYWVKMRYKSSEFGTVDLIRSDQLHSPEWTPEIPDRVNIGGLDHVVYGQLEWQVLIIDGRSGETVSTSDWFHFFFSALNGLPCP